VDAVVQRAEALAAGLPDCVASDDVGRVIDDPRVDVVIVATTHDALADTARQAAAAGKHVLIEKPGARTADELSSVLTAVERAGVAAKVGFNHRFHPGILKARRLFDEGQIGQLMYIRARYGHGGRLHYEREWRADPTVSGGGELLDQGSHLIDLARWFAGDFSEVSGHLATYFWPMQVEDNAFVLLKTARGQAASLHASWTEWKNLFSFEVFGREGKLQVDGLGGSYGTERLTHYHMRPTMGPPDTLIWEFPGPDESWQREFAHFAECIETGAAPCGSLVDALANLRIIEELYRSVGCDHHA
jgi:predicted dehydrogenase